MSDTDIVRIGLIQAHHDTDGAQPVEVHKREAIAKHVKMIREAAQRGAQIVCLQELFYGPYFCTEQSPKWYEATEHIPDGPTTRQMVFAINAEERSVGIDHRRRVVVHAADRALVHRHDQRDPELAGEVLHLPRRRAVRDVLRRLVPFRALLRAEVGPVKELLQADDLRAALRRLADHLHVLRDRFALVHLDRLRAVGVVVRLDQADANDVSVAHLTIPSGGSAEGRTRRLRAAKPLQMDGAVSYTHLTLPTI